MAEHDYVIANQNGANTRSDLNNALAAIVSNNSKATAPTTTYAYMWWADTANDILKQRNGADSAWISILTLSTGAPLATIANFTSTGIDDNAAGALAITIDSSENVMVNKTSQDMAAVGAQFRGDAVGLLQVTRTGGEALHLNRLSSDGNVLSVYKDTTLKGSIAVTAAGIGIQLGGTGAANTLDDYEEGTWTPSFTNSSTTTGAYTKIGNKVYCSAYFTTDAVGGSGVNINGLPFTTSGSDSKRGGGSVSYQNKNATETWQVLVESNTTAFRMRLGSATRELDASAAAFVEFSYTVA